PFVSADKAEVKAVGDAPDPTTAHKTVSKPVMKRPTIRGWANATHRRDGNWRCKGCNQRCISSQLCGAIRSTFGSMAIRCSSPWTSKSVWLRKRMPLAGSDRHRCSEEVRIGQELTRRTWQDDVCLLTRSRPTLREGPRLRVGRYATPCT